jgi:serine protease Do
MTNEIADSYNIPYERGVLVVRVARGSPADSSGLSAGDVILEADKRVLENWEDLQHLLQEKKAGDSLEFLIGRDRKQGRLVLKLQETSS